jgi:membrane protein DedA with SNARE-associated domain
MYYLGYFFGHRVVDSNRIKFINQKDLEKPEKWFRQYGYYLIIANRFLSGTRAVIAFFAGMSELAISKTIILSLLSALLWNSILIYLGIVFGDNYESIIDYISLYGKIIFPIALIVIGLFIWYKIKNNGKVDK